MVVGVLEGWVTRWKFLSTVLRTFTDFRRRFLTLLSYNFREFGSVTALSVVEAANAGIKTPGQDKSKRG